MNNYPAAFDRMLNAWNENNPELIRGHLEAALVEDVYFVDPSIEVTGIDAFEAMVHEVQAKLPGAVYSRISKVDSHHHVFRYHWAIHVQGKLAVQGFDVIEARGDKVARVLGFFGEFDAD